MTNWLVVIPEIKLDRHDPAHSQLSDPAYHPAHKQAPDLAPEEDRFHQPH